MLKFGTDGIRGVADIELTNEFMRLLGEAVAYVLNIDSIVVGRDSRISGSSLMKSLADGLNSSGVDVLDLGIAPTPAVMSVAKNLGLNCAVISASHNPYLDNGIKLVGNDGFKLSRSVEIEIENYIEKAIPKHKTSRIGRVAQAQSELLYWRDQIRNSVTDSLSGVKTVIDCANGASAKFALPIFESLGAEVFVINDSDDGVSINDQCGATNLVSLVDAVKKHPGYVGIAFDGDADRMIAIDENLNEIDGDYIVAMFAEDMRDRRTLQKNTVVVTVMSNFGFYEAMKNKGIDVVTTEVGDKFVSEALIKDNLSLGGEQSGHIIRRDITSTGDGILTAVLMLDLMKRSEKYLYELRLNSMEKYPQTLVNVRHSGVSRESISKFLSSNEFKSFLHDIESSINNSGRVFVRQSGTEPLVRVMVEMTTQDRANQIANSVASELEHIIENSIRL